jgi:8-oxo-dGTP pyrophosphatase MutT (NUDIX family)
MKMEENELLFDNEWIQVRKVAGWYTFAHQPKGDGVAVLVYDRKNQKAIVRIECTPPHGSEMRRTSLTGMIDEGWEPRATAKKEVLEEAGIDAPEEAFQSFGWVYPLKSSDYKQHLFALEWDSTKERLPIKGDGSKGEEGAYAEWDDLSKVIMVQDPCIAAIAARVFLAELL